ncbi:hypothetical protein DICPUDRAFT_87783 [Dictyostelium purpureum]|uniref:Mitochondrial substrate carrier family protein n=1 Tax=Dictyostelium purpureum TaxID=5786 RepID=F0ZKB3_DICPU|nr:uncharacterized protein DICPUDRAFT_87783 [Dictyostelium purpureum]EGC35614.1 hypothetical protein DICPUDRAFT_87783 [Dictyostelium purpureum]|eukprot:XP_003287851.1 hypothetical protein DICPUDRAFT_87783 [Dictyostelium purpureum]
MFSGCGAGVMASLFTTPLDVIKTTMQVDNQNHKTIVGTVKKIFARGGLKNFYLGLKPTLIGQIPSWAVYFSTYQYFKELFSAKNDVHNILTKDSPFIYMGSAIIAGATTSTLTNPIWLIKTRFITQEMDGRQKRYRGVFHSISSIYHEEGFRALYKGLGPSLLGVLHVGVQFPLYEKFKVYFAHQNKSDELTVVQIMAASSLSKIIASIVAYPHEVLRSRLQDSSPDSPNRTYQGNLVQMVKQIIREEGWRGLYKGMGVNLLRVTPSCVITFTSYEFIKKYLTQLEIF